MTINTVASIAKESGISKTRVRQLLKEIGIEPNQTIGRTPVYLDEAVARLEARNTRRGRPKTGTKPDQKEYKTCPECGHRVVREHPKPFHSRCWDRFVQREMTRQRNERAQAASRAW